MTITERIQRQNEWFDKWNPRVGLVMYYLLYVAAVWSLVWVFVDIGPTPPIYEFVASDYPRASVFVVAFLFWRCSKDGISYNKMRASDP